MIYKRKEVRGMNLSQLKTFCSVARTLSFTASASELMISQPAVSRQILTLEDEIGAKLFIREHNTLYLTAAGRHLYESLPGKLEELEALFFSVHLFGLGKKRKIKIGLLRDQKMSSPLIDVLRDMRDVNYYVTVQQYDFSNLEKALENREIDAAVTLVWADNAFEGCSRLDLYTERLCLAVNREYAPEIPDPLDRSSLSQFSLSRPVMVPKVSSFPRKELGAVMERMSHLWTGIIEEEPDSIVPMVQTGIGSALINESHVLKGESSVDLMPLDFLEPVQIAAFWIEEKKNEDAADFIGRLKIAFERHT